MDDDVEPGVDGHRQRQHPGRWRDHCRWEGISRRRRNRCRPKQRLYSRPWPASARYWGRWRIWWLWCVECGGGPWWKGLRLGRDSDLRGKWRRAWQRYAASQFRRGRRWAYSPDSEWQPGDRWKDQCGRNQ